MNKTLIEVIVVLVLASSLGGVIYIKKPKPIVLTSMCPTDIMMCPDGSSVPRTGINCEFGICKQELPSYMKPVEQASSTTLIPSSPETKNMPTKIASIPSIKKTQTVLDKVTESASLLVKKVSSSIASIVKPASTDRQTPTPTIVITPSLTTIDEIRYTIDHNKVLDQNGNIIYIIPPSMSLGFSGTGAILDTHVVNAVAISNVLPLIGAIPVDGLPGKYYLSENSFGNAENCQFSNRIYILDTVKNTKTLMYEENNSTIAPDDPRACNSEMYLLATQGEKLILKYHTVGTNMTCDSTWSEPEKTWFLDVTKLRDGTSRYYITPDLYTEAEKVEAQCRTKYQPAAATTTEGIAG